MQRTSVLCPPNATPPLNFATALINDRFSHCIAAIEGCIQKLISGICKGRNLRIADLDGLRSIEAGVFHFWMAAFLKLRQQPCTGI
ncbi:hypothetical protein SAMN06265373_10810 [Shimia sagamensis]|uniref:Uncharacterized protein n=1 Tax=Shimia sagamensis TaxID=1566352 RepID=A0ABY1PD32_9RHOB|nr:hypothetical protein SAMN06265373_10810 [Shimia sagamensis]